MAKVSALVRSTLTSARDGIGAPGHYLKAELHSQGINVIGHGQYGAVIEEDAQVFKIFGKDEAGYGAFIKFLKGKSSTLLPRVKTVGTFGNYTCVHIEKLVKMDEMGDRLSNQLAWWINAYVRTYLSKKYGIGWKEVVSFPKEAEKYVNRANCMGLLKKMADWMVANQENGRRIGFDLHNGNFMLRKGPDGAMQLVITDPWCND